jgi:hypothetical protein
VTEPTPREAAVASVDQTCPRCGAAREPRQEYCVECGLRLPKTTGALAGFRRWWIGRFGWYPGDWVWVSLLGLLVAIAGAAVAIAVTGHKGKGGTTIVASPPATTTTSAQTTTTTPALPKPPEPTTTTTTRTTTTTTTTTTAPARTTTTAGPNGQVVWPAATSGWTVVLGSYPVSQGQAAAATAARRAAASGLPQVGMLASAAWSSLHPGYYVVFSGIYPSNAAAQAALAHAQAGGYATAYVRQIAH